MRLLYGTRNPAKLKAMRKRLKELPKEFEIEIIGLNDLELNKYCYMEGNRKEYDPTVVDRKGFAQTLMDVPEEGNTPLENARQKAQLYYKKYGIPVFSCDSGLYIKELPDSLQPGVHVRRINGKYLSDKEMLTYYGGLAKRYGNLTARYQNAICLILGKDQIFESMAESLASQPFFITAKPHSIQKKGFPLDSLSLDLETGMYYYDRAVDKLDELAVESGFLEFFKQCLTEVRRMY